jgi:hypothetical protein
MMSREPGIIKKKRHTIAPAEARRNDLELDVVGTGWPKWAQFYTKILCGVEDGSVRGGH